MKVEFELELEVVARRVAELVLEALDVPASEPWQLVDVDQVAAILGRSRRWVHGAVKERGLPVIRLDGGALAFDLDDVRAWARARRVPAEIGDPLAAILQASRKPASKGTPATRSRTAMQKVRA